MTGQMQFDELKTKYDLNDILLENFSNKSFVALLRGEIQLEKLQFSPKKEMRLTEKSMGSEFKESIKRKYVSDTFVPVVALSKIHNPL